MAHVVEAAAGAPEETESMWPRLCDRASARAKDPVVVIVGATSRLFRVAWCALGGDEADAGAETWIPVAASAATLLGGARCWRVVGDPAAFGARAKEALATSDRSLAVVVADLGSRAPASAAAAWLDALEGSGASVAVAAFGDGDAGALLRACADRGVAAAVLRSGSDGGAAARALAAACAARLSAGGGAAAEETVTADGSSFYAAGDAVDAAASPDDPPPRPAPVAARGADAPLASEDEWLASLRSLAEGEGGGAGGPRTPAGRIRAEAETPVASDSKTNVTSFFESLMAGNLTPSK